MTCLLVKADDKGLIRTTVISMEEANAMYERVQTQAIVKTKVDTLEPGTTLWLGPHKRPEDVILIVKAQLCPTS